MSLQVLRNAVGTVEMTFRVVQNARRRVGNGLAPLVKWNSTGRIDLASGVKSNSTCRIGLCKCVRFEFQPSNGHFKYCKIEFDASATILQVCEGGFLALGEHFSTPAKSEKQCKIKK